MITVNVRDWESGKPGTYKCHPIKLYGKTYVRRSSLPSLYVDLPNNTTINGKRIYIFPVMQDENGNFVLS